MNEHFFGDLTINMNSNSAESAAEHQESLPMPMRVVLISKSGETWTAWLPATVEGHYIFQDDNGIDADLPFYIEASGTRWVAYSGRAASFRQESSEGIDHILGQEVVLTDKMLVRIYRGEERYLLYSELQHVGDSTFLPYYFEEHTDYLIGRRENCEICYPNITVSRHHAKLHWEDNCWFITDQFSTNGVYVNGHRVENSQRLHNGDSIFIMGLYILVGVGFFSINNANGRIHINTPKIRRILSDKDVTYALPPKERPDASVFDRQPRKMIQVASESIEIDMPPMAMSANKIPLLLRLGSPMVMGGRAIATGNVLMALTSLVFPALTQGLTEKERKDYDAKRTERYRAYLSEKKREIEKEQQSETELLKNNYPSLSEVLSFPVTRQRLWERRSRDEDFLHIRIGTGEIPMIAEKVFNKRRFQLESDPLEEEMYALAETPVMLQDAPVMLALAEDRTIGVQGDETACMTLFRNLILQIATTHSYDEVKIIVLVDKEQEFALDFARYFPHCWDNEKTIRFFAVEQTEAQSISAHLSLQMEEIIGSEDPHRILKDRARYVVFAQSKRLFDSVEIMKGVLHHEKYCGVTIFTAFPGFPKECSKIIDLWEHPQIIDLRRPEEKWQRFRLDDYPKRDAEKGISALMRTKLKVGSQLFSLPGMVTFLEMFGVGRVEHLNPLKRWADHNAVKSLSTPVGIATDGRLFTLDLHEKRQGPHGLVAGMTGSGKSEFIITYILSMAVNYSPDEVAFILIDYKGGGLADAFENQTQGIHLPHLVGTITNLDGTAIQRSLMSINSELKRRQSVFKRAKSLTGEGTMDIYDYQRLYRAGRVSEPMPHLFIISDEFAELKSQQPEFMDELISAARIGRSLGVHLILATQKPGGVVNNQIWSNTKFRVCLKVQDRGDSIEMLKRPEAAELKQTGRFYLQVGYNEFFALGQSAWCGAAYVPQDEVVAEVDDSVQFIDHAGQTILTAKPQIERKAAEGKQVAAVVRYLSELAKRENIGAKMLWQEPLPQKLELAELQKHCGESADVELSALIGLVDDPKHQRQFPLYIDLLGLHSIMLCGTGGSGKSTFIRTMLYSLVCRCSPEEFNYYILDLSNSALAPFSRLPHCGAYLTERNESDFDRLLNLLQDLIRERRQAFAQADVSDYAMYRLAVQRLPELRKYPLILVIIDGYAGIANFKRAGEINSILNGFMRDGVSFGIRFLLSCNHSNELNSRLKQELDYRIALNAKDKFEYGDILNCRCTFSPPQLSGRGLCIHDGDALEYQTAMLMCDEDEQARVGALRDRLDELSKRNAGCGMAQSLPMVESSMEYAEFCKGFAPGRIPLGFSQADMKKVALPLQQLQGLALYFGNPAGVRPVLRNFLTAAAENKMQTYIIRRSLDSLFADDGRELLAPELADSIHILDCTTEVLASLDQTLLEEIRQRNHLRDKYCSEHGIPATEKGRIKKAAGYIRVHTAPILVLFESFLDFCETEKTPELEGEFIAFFSRTKGYNLHFIGCFYPEDGGVNSSELMKALCKDELVMMFGGSYDRQGVLPNLPLDYRRIDKPSQQYDRFLMKYRGEYYAMQMPCGDLAEVCEDPDDAAIL